MLGKVALHGITCMSWWKLPT